jgi:hypothetical protein
MIYPIRRKNGEVIELEADDVLSVEDILALAEEDSGAKAVNERIDRLAALVGEVASRPPPAITYQPPASPAPIVNVAAPVNGASAGSPIAWNCSVTKRDSDGRIADFTFKAVMPVKPLAR